MTTRDLLEKRANLVSEMRQITTAANGDGGDLSAEQSQKFDSFKTQLEALEKQIQRQHFLDDAERRMAGEPINGNGDHRLDAELRGYSLTKAIAGAAGLSVDWGREKELSTEIAKRSGRSFEGIAVPMALFTNAPYEKRVITTALPAGGPGANLISTDFRGDQFIDILRPNSLVYRSGATMLTGLIGNVTIPALTVDNTLSWVAENAAITATDPEVDPVTLAPKHCGIRTEYSRNMLLQTSPSIESILRTDMAKVIASGIDKAAITGGGSNEPVGILATSGIGDVPGGTDSLAPTWANVLALIATVQNANGSAMGFITTHNAVKKMRSTVRVATTDSRMIMEGRDTLADYPLSASSNVPNNLVKGTSGSVCSALIFGDFSEVLIGVWSELDVLVNPFESTAYSKGNVQIRAMATLDIKLRHAASFAATKDLLTT